MQEVSVFRGLAGEVICQYLKPGTFLTAIPIVVIFALVLTLGAMMLPNSLQWLLSIITPFIAAMMTARFAIPASHGDVSAGWFNDHLDKGDTFYFAARYMVITIAWLLPVMVMIWFLSGNAMSLLGGGINPTAFAKLGFTGILAMLLVVLFVIMPATGFIVAVQTDGIFGGVNPSPWLELYHYRLKDLLVFFVSIIGGVIVFFMVYSVPMVLFVVIAGKISFQAGMLASFVFVLPFCMSPILIGRLSGAFAYGDGEIEVGDGGEDDVSDLRHSLLNDGDPRIAAAAAEALVKRGDEESPQQIDHEVIAAGKKAFEKIFRRVKEFNSEQLSQTIKQKEDEYDQHKMDPNLAVELTLLYRRAKQDSKATELAVKAVKLCIGHGQGIMAGMLFASFGKASTQLKPDQETLQNLGSILLKLERYQLAVWCVHRAIPSTDRKAAEKKMLDIAEAAANKDKFKEAILVYQFFLQKLPDSGFVDFVKQAMQQQKNRLDSSSSDL